MQMITFALFSVTGTNLALRKKAYQINLHPSYKAYKYQAENIVDGSDSTILNGGSCSGTRTSWQSWWAVDLEKQFVVKHVVIKTMGNGRKWISINVS